MSFLVNNSEQTFTSCETKDFSVIYEVNSKIKVYYPDFTDGVFIYEIKPSSLLNIFNNDIKIKEAKIKYGDKFKVITELESPYIKKDLIYNLIKKGDIVLTKKSEIVLEKYKK